MSNLTLVYVKGWQDHQHYKNRTPPWIKLHRGLLDDFDFHCLPVASRALAPMLWLLASENEGIVNCDPAFLSFRLRITEAEAKGAVKPLIDNGWLILEHGASNVLAECEQDACLEGETEKSRERGASAPPAPKKSKGERIPDNFPAEPELTWAKAEHPAVDSRAEAAKFSDYWRSIPGAKGVKLDWPATWRNWIRRSSEGKPAEVRTPGMRRLN